MLHLRPPTSGPLAADEILAICARYKLQKNLVCKLANLAPSTVWRWRHGTQPTRERWLLLLRSALELADQDGHDLPADHLAALQALRLEVDLPVPKTIEARVTRLEQSVARLEQTR
jgi:hypothetical protein